MSVTAPERSIAEDFQRYFEVLPADTPELCEETFRIRYAVYAAELGWEDRARFPAGMETDEYDSHSIGCLLRHRAQNCFVGCVRLVLGEHDPAQLFPFERAVAQMGGKVKFDASSSDWRREAAEISRVAVKSEFRRRRHERHSPYEVPPDESISAANERRVFPHIALGLYLGAAALGMQRGLERVFAIMEPRLARRLRSYGLIFDEVGPTIEHHGLRVPYCLQRAGFKERLVPPIRALYELLESEISDAAGART
jgi:N-acyl amino acid synthase of PEP-CTERM/exosortase system